MLQGLEREYGFQLLIRNKAGIFLTENGKQVLEPMKKVISWNENLSQTVAKINGLQTGTLRIGMFPSVAVEWLPDIIQKFQKKYPGIQIRLMDGDYDEIAEWLKSGKIDCGFLAQSENMAVNFIPLIQDAMLAILSKEHPMSNAATFPVGKFSEEAFIFPHRGLDSDVRQVLQQAKVIPNIKYDVRGDDAIIALVNKNLGVGMLPELYLKNHSKGIITKRIDPNFYRIIGIAVPEQEYKLPVVTQFIDCLQKWLKDHYDDVLF